jgi:hypothetical protein
MEEMVSDGKSLPVWPYHATFVVDRRVISLRERSQSEYVSTIEVTIDRHPVGEISLLSPYLVSLGIGPRQVVVWGNTDLYAIDYGTYALRAFPQNDAVIAAYPIGHLWCLVRELSVVIADLDRQHIDEVFDHNEVILASWWEGNQLFVEDFEHRRFVFELSDPGPRLTRVDITTE